MVPSGVQEWDYNSCTVIPFDNKTADYCIWRLYPFWNDFLPPEFCLKATVPIFSRAASTFQINNMFLRTVTSKKQQIQYPVTLSWNGSCITGWVLHCRWMSCVLMNCMSQESTASPTWGSPHGFRDVVKLLHLTGLLSTTCRLMHSSVLCEVAEKPSLYLFCRQDKVRKKYINVLMYSQLLNK